MSDLDRIRIAVADDHAVVRTGLAALLLAQGDLELVGEAADGADAVRLCSQVRPDVMLMDLNMPGMDGATATKAIHHLFPDVKVLMLTSCRDPEAVRTSLRAGAIGYLLKDIAPEALIQAIRDAAEGRPTLGREVTEALIRVVTGEDLPEEELTEREQDVLALLASGKTNPEIAQQLMVSRSTVKFHLSSIFSKLGVSTRTECVARAMQRHLVS